MFLGVFPSDLLPQQPIAPSGTIIVNTEPHTEGGSHWLAIHLQSRPHSSFFDSYGLPPFIPSNHLKIGTASCGTTTDARTYEYRLRKVLVSSPCTWTEVIHRDNSLGFLLRRQLTGRCRTCLPPKLDPYEVYPGEGSIEAVALRGTYVRPSYFKLY